MSRLNGRRPGRTRRRLAALIEDLAREQLGEVWDVDPWELDRNAPVYAQARHDGISWDCYVTRPGGRRFRIYSYHAMGEILRRPFRKLSGMDQHDGELIAGTEA